jgi:hypothetical protein
MKLKFIGGPWAGVEFEAAAAPDYIRFQSLVEELNVADLANVPEKEDADIPKIPDEADDADFPDDCDDPLRKAVVENAEIQKRPFSAYEREKDTGDVPVVVYNFSPGALPWWETDLSKYL